MKSGIITFAATLAILSSTARAQWSRQTFDPIALNPTEDCNIVRIDGEHIPFPLRNANTVFELADGETYLLNGTLVLLSGKVFLKVDLHSQPWLATAKVIANPYFEVSSIDAISVLHYGGKFVQVAVIADRDQTAPSQMRSMKLKSILPPSMN